MRSGRAIPPRLLEPPPQVQQGLGMYMKAFFDLASDRHDGGRIPWSTIRAWCDAHELDADEADDAHFILSRMDMAYIEWAKAKGKKLSEERKMAEEARNANTKGVRR